MQTLILAVAFFSILVLLVAAFAFLDRKRLEAARASRERLFMGERGPVALSILRDDRASEIPFLNALLTGRAFSDSVSRMLLRAGSKRTVGEFVLGMAAFGVAGFLLGQWWLGPTMGFLFGVLGAGLPFALVARMRSRRELKIEEQLPDAIDMLVNALRAGYSLQAAMEFVGREVNHPLGPEFLRFYEEQRLGVDIRTALVNLQERIGTLEIRMFVTSLLIQRETGGNLSEVLSNIATLIRERLAFRGQVRTLTAEPKMSANILAALPVFVFGVLILRSPGYIKPLLETPQGQFMLAYAITSVIVGYIVMLRIADIEI